MTLSDRRVFSSLLRMVRELLSGALPLITLLLVGSTVAQAQTGTQSGAQVLAKHLRPVVANHQAALVGAMPADQSIKLSIVLPLRNQAALTSLLARLYDPASPDYRKFLSVQDFTAQFGPTADDYAAVVAFATANGFTVKAAPANRLIVPLSGTVAQVNQAFHVQMNLYQHPTENRTFYSLDREPSLDLSVPVARIAGLDSYAPPKPLSLRQQANAHPLVTGSGPGGSYLGSDMRAAYYGGTTLSGIGQAVGLVEFGGYNLSDVNETFSTAGQTYSVPINNVFLDGATLAPSPEYGDGEQVLDIVQAIGMAPGLSQVRVYIGSPDVSDDPTVLNSMASENIAKQLSCSWNFTTADPTADDVFLLEMATQGQTFFTASGDNGAYDTQIDPNIYPADDAYVTTVGGTSLLTSAAGGGWTSEKVWNDYNAGSGGGISPNGIVLPSWQSGVATSANGGSTTLRNSPDVAMEADFDNWVCQLGTCAGDWGGTSFATPRWAGFMALVNQQAIEAGNAPNGGLGFLNPPLYKLAESTSYASDLHDITSGNNDTDNQPVYFSAVTGYDLTTGWGSPAGQSLIDALAGPQVPGFFLATTPNPVDIAPGSTGTVNLTVIDAGGFNGSVSLAVTSTLPTGVTAAFSPTTTSGTSTLTLTASSAATNSSTPVTITGTSGNVTATTTILAVVHTPTFSLATSPGSMAVNLSSSGTSTVSVVPQFGFTGAVSLSATGLPSGVTATFSPASATTTSTLTLAVSSTALGGTSTITITGTSGNLTASTTLLLTVNGPSFTLYGPGTLSVGPGTTTSAYIEVYDQFGFTGNVTLAASGLPAGATATFSPNPASGSATMTVVTSASTPLGQTTVTITGTSGALTASTTFNLGVYAPNFTLSGPGSLSVGQGTTTTSNVYVNDEYGFNGNVTLAVSGLPAGATATFSPNPTTGNATLTVVTSASTPVGQSTVTVTGTSGSLSATTTFTFRVYAPNFTLSGPGTVSIGQGATTTGYAYVNGQYGFNGSVTLAVTGLPAGVTASFSPNPTTYSSTITFVASSTAPVGQYTATITGTSGTQTASTTFTLGVYAPTFTIADYGTVSIGQGTSTTTTTYVTGQYGFNGSVNLAISGLPTGVTASFSPNPTTYSSTLTLTASSTASLGQYTATITGTSGSVTASTTLTVGVFAPTFTLYSSYSTVNVGQGTSTGTDYVSVQPQYGFAGSVNLSVTGLPAGVTAAFSPNPTTSTATMTLTASSTATLGQYNATITGTSGSQTVTTPLTIGVYAPTFTLSTAYSPSVAQGSTLYSYVGVNPQYGFTGSVNLSISGLPSGVTAAFTTNPTSGTSTLTYTASSTAALGQYTVTITGTSGSQTASTTTTLTVSAPSFYLNAGSANVALGGTASTYIGLNDGPGFNGGVTLSVSGLPAGVTATISPNPIYGPYDSTITFTASSSATVGSSVITITGTYGTVTATTTLTLGVYGPGFVLNAGSVYATQGVPTSTTVAVNSQYGFTGSVTLSVSGLPTGVTATFATNPTTSTSVLNFTIPVNAPVGQSNLTITGTSGNLTASTVIALVIQAESYTLTASPTALNVAAGGISRTGVTIGAPAGYTGSVSLAATGLPSGVTATFSPATTSTGSILTFAASNSASTGTSTITITGSLGAENAVTTVALTVLPAVAPAAASATTLVLNAGGGSASSVAAGTMVTATASVTSGSTPVTKGLVNFCAASTTTCDALHLVGSAELTGAGSAVLRFIPGPGSRSYQAVFVGTAANASSSSSVANLTVTAAVATTTTIAQSGAQGNYTLTSTVTGKGSNVPTGNVSFLDTTNGNASLASATVGSGTATYSASTTPVTTPVTYPGPVAKGDFNEDGIPDLVVGTYDIYGFVSIMIGNGDGTFKAPVSLPPGVFGEIPLVADFNRDGHLDILVNTGTSTLLFLGKGDGTFNTPTTVSNVSAALVAGDFNGDGIPDFAGTSTTNSVAYLQVSLGNGDGTFTALTINQSVPPPFSLTVADFNGDGILDLAEVPKSGTLAPVLIGNGDGTFALTPSQQYINGVTSLAVGDFNQDGKPDLIIGGQASTGNYAAFVELGNGDGTFSAGTTLTLSSSANGMAVADFNQDGKADLSIAGYYNGLLSTFIGNGDGTFASPITSTIGLEPDDSIAIGDWNGDGVPDLALSNYASGNVSIIQSSLNWTATATATGISPAGSGTHAVDASYAGDSEYKSSVSSTTNLSGSSSTATVALNPSSSAITTIQTLSVTVTVSGGAGSPVATGTVALAGSNFSSQSATLSGGTAVLTVSPGYLPVGNDPFTVSYTPDAASPYAAASANGSVNVTAATPIVSLVNYSPSITTIDPIGIGVTVLASQATPVYAIGTVTLTSGSYTSAPVTLSGGSAEIVVPADSFAPGTDTLVVNFTPSQGSAYAAASGTGSITVTKATPAVRLTLSSSTITSLQPLTVTVAVSGVPLGGGSGAPTATGSVTLTGGGYTSSAATLSGGSATITIPAGSLAAGTDTLSVAYTPDTAGAAIYTSATGTSSVGVGKGAASVNLSLGASSITTIQPLTVTVAVSGGAGNPTATGSVTLSSGSYTSAAATLSGGAATITIPAGSLAVGSDTLTASYTPDGASSYSAASGSGSVTVAKATPTVGLTLSSSTITSLQSLTVTVAVSGGAGAPTATGSVTLTGGGYTSSATTLSGGNASITIPAGSLAAGTDTLSVAYTPDTAGAAIYTSATGTGSVGVGKGAASVNLSLGASSITTIQPLTVTVAVSGGAGNPTATGSVTLLSGSYTSAAATLSGGAATITIPAGSLAVGSDTLTASYTPDGASSYSAASGSGSVTVAKATPTVGLTLSSSTITSLQSLTVTVAVSGGAGAPTATGSVTLTGGGYTSSATTLSGGSASITIPAGSLAAGNDVLQATYTPDATASATYTGVTQTAPVAVSVAMGTTNPTVAVVPSTATITNLQTDTVVVTVTGQSGGITPTGSVTLSSGTYSAQQTLAGGTTTFTIPAGALAAGADTLTAAYTGDSIYSTNTGTGKVTVAPVVMSASTIPNIPVGSSGTGTLTLLAGSNYAGSLTLTCSLTNSPAGAVSLPTCQPSVPSLTLASGGTGTATITITTIAQSTSSLEMPLEMPFRSRPWLYGGGTLSAAMLLFLVPARRRRIAVWVLLLGVLAAGATGCGTASNTPQKTVTPGTTTGSYTFTVTATDSTSAVTTATTVAVTVQ